MTIDRQSPNRLLALGMSMTLAASGKSRQDVAEMAGVSATHITKLVSGLVNPSQKVLTEFARAVNCPISEIYRLGEAALERDHEERMREDLRRAADERTAGAVIRAATWLDEAGVDQVIEALLELKAKHSGEQVA